MIRWLRHKIAGRELSEARVALFEAQRAYVSAKTDRLNDTHWSKASDRPINDVLRDDLDTLRMRTHFESKNNGTLEGVIQTHVVDVVGARGPSLQVQGPSEEYNRAFEGVWKRWAAMPDVNEAMSLADMLQLGVRGLWVDGEWLHQVVTAKERDGVTMRLLAVDVRRIGATHGDSASITMGVERDRNGRHLAYHISGQAPELGRRNQFDTKPIQASNILHVYRMLEVGQVRGAPWLAPVLQTVADLRDYDAQVLDAARAAADNAVLLESDHPDAEFFAIPETTELERRMITMLPPGWKASQMKAEQPAPFYESFKHEKLREVGRVACMPLMMVLLDSSGHNYSSARFDGQVYNRGNMAIQAWLERVYLNRVADKVSAEAELSRAVPPRPVGTEFVWTWPVPPHVDPTKEAEAERTRLQNRTLSMRRACAAHGIEWDQLQKELIAEEPELAAVGGPLWPQGGAGGDGVNDDDNDDADADDRTDIAASVERLMAEVFPVAGGRIAENGHAEATT